MAGAPEPGGYGTCPSLHAEANALLTGDRRDREGGTLYVTAHPCIECGKLIANSGLRRLVVDTDDEVAPWRDPNTTYDRLVTLGMNVTVDGAWWPRRVDR